MYTSCSSTMSSGSTVRRIRPQNPSNNNAPLRDVHVSSRFSSDKAVTNPPSTIPANSQANLFIHQSQNVSRYEGSQHTWNGPGNQSQHPQHAHDLRPQPTRQVYPEFLSFSKTALLQLNWAWEGLKDSFRWNHVVNIVISDGEIRAHMLKSLILNSLGLFSIFVFDLIILPLLHRKASPSSIVSTWGVYQLFWVLPVVGGSLYFNGIWCSTIADKLYTLQHGRQSTIPTTYTGFITSIASSAYRVILIVTSLAVSWSLSYIPFVGSTLSFIFVCWVDSYYCFEFVWRAKGLSLAARVRYLEERWAYFLAFGLPTTALCYLGNSLVNVAIFALIFPSYIILAMYAHPTPTQPYSPAPPVLSRTTGETIYPLPSPLVPVRLPVFQLVIWINDWVIRGIDVMTGGRRRPSTASRKQWYGDDEHAESGLPLKAPGRSAGNDSSSLRQRTHVE